MSYKEKKKGAYIKYNVLYTTLVKYYQNQKSGTHMCKNSSRKLSHYFESRKITVVTDFPLGDILHNRDVTGRISKWAVELGALNIDFTPRKAIKSQALADFVAEWTEEADEAFKRLKGYLTSSPVLTPPKKYEDMMLYIATTSTMISTTIVVEREEEGRVYKVQRPVHYISEVLLE